MPLLNPLSDAQATDAAKSAFRAIHGKFGAVPNIFRAMGHSPEVLQATLAFNEAIKSDLDPKLRELAYLKASQLNKCGYCTHYHRISGQKAGLSEAQVRDLAEFETSPAYTDVDKDVLRFAQEWTQHGKASAEVVQRLARTLTPGQIVVLAATLGLANWTNRFNESFGNELP